MTREHLYRGKRLDNGQWIYGNLLAPAAGEVNAYYIKPGLNGRRVAVEPDSVGQYIGLDDTFGNRVFNGDILKLTNNDKVSYQLEDDKIILKPKKNESPLRKMFDGFDTEAYFKSEPNNKEIDWGKPQGKETF